MADQKGENSEAVRGPGGGVTLAPPTRRRGQRGVVKGRNGCAPVPEHSGGPRSSKVKVKQGQGQGHAQARQRRR